MPELPEVETIARKLRSALVGQTITEVDVLWARTVDRPDVASFREELVGARIDQVRRRGKFLILELSTERSLLVHLRMSGSFALVETGEEVEEDKHTRITLTLENGSRLLYVDPRKFGRFYLVKDEEEVLRDLGPEPLGPDFSSDELRERLSGRRGEIKRLLLDQRFIAGLGNIYASEILWHARVHPQRIAGSLSEGESRRLYEAIVCVLHQGIEHGGTSLDDRQYVYPDGGLGEHQEHLKVYDRADDACPRCGYTLTRIVQGQRSTYYCPRCQPCGPEKGTRAKSSSVGTLSAKGDVKMETTTLKIDGMSCQMCVKHVTQALQNVQGVTEVEVNLEPGTAVVTYDPGSADMSDFQDAVAEAGYQVMGPA